MENTLENKAKFFAQYWDQDVIQVDMPEWSGNTRFVDALTMESDGFKHFSILLKKANNINKEEALLLSKMRYTLQEYINVENGKCMVSCHENQISLIQTQVDFLRSKGYALPWMGLSVKQLEEYGWIKLKK